MQPPAALSGVYRKADIACARMSPDEMKDAYQCVRDGMPGSIDLRLI